MATAKTTTECVFGEESDWDTAFDDTKDQALVQAAWWRLLRDYPKFVAQEFDTPEGMAGGEAAGGAEPREYQAAGRDFSPYYYYWKHNRLLVIWKVLMIRAAAIFQERAYENQDFGEWARMLDFENMRRMSE